MRSSCARVGGWTGMTTSRDDGVDPRTVSPRTRRRLVPQRPHPAPDLLADHESADHRFVPALARVQPERLVSPAVLRLGVVAGPAVRAGCPEPAQRVAGPVERVACPEQHAIEAE